MNDMEVTQQIQSRAPEIWTKHCSKDGRTFWHNGRTGKSTWEKPDMLKTDLERLTSLTTLWKEYTASDGRSYWYNKETKKSVWEVPDEIKQLQEEISCDWHKFEDKNEARDRLKTLFKLKGVTVKARFEEAKNAIKSDSRFGYFSILGTGEMKQVFAEYQTQLKKQERERERIRKVESRKSFLETLSKWKPFHPSLFYKQFEKDHMNEWWMTCLPSSEKEDLFNDYMEENEASFYEAQKAQRAEMKLKLMDFFRKSSSLNVDSRWTEAVDAVLDNEELQSAEPKTVLNCWIDHVYKLEQLENDNRKKCIQRERRLRREKFQQIIQELIKSGKVHAKSRFSDILSLYKNDPAYTDLVGVPLATPMELFNEALEPVIVSYEKEKTLLKQILKSHDIKVTPTTSIDQFVESLIASCPEDFLSISNTNLELFFESLRRHACRRSKKKRDEFEAGRKDESWKNNQEKSRGKHAISEEEEEDEEGLSKDAEPHALREKRRSRSPSSKNYKYSRSKRYRTSQSISFNDGYSYNDGGRASRSSSVKSGNSVASTSKGSPAKKQESSKEKPEDKVSPPLIPA